MSLSSRQGLLVIVDVTQATSLPVKLLEVQHCSLGKILSFCFESFSAEILLSSSSQAPAQNSHSHFP